MVQVPSIAFIRCPPSCAASGKIICIPILDWKKKTLWDIFSEDQRGSWSEQTLSPEGKSMQGNRVRNRIQEKVNTCQATSLPTPTFLPEQKGEMWSDKPRQGQMMTVNKSTAVMKMHENAIKCYVSDPILSLSKTTEEQPWTRTTLTTLTTLQHTLTKAVNKYKYPFLKHHT